MYFSDIHSHILYGTDDGPKNREEMFKTVDLAYENGIRLICATPHFHPGFFGDNREKASRAFDDLAEYCKNKYPDLELYIGNELYYMHEAIAWLKNGICKPMGETRSVLVEFDVESSENFIAEGVDRILNAGFVPIIAHAERYEKLGFGRIWAMKQNGAMVQVNASSFVTNLFDFGTKKRIKQMLSEDMIDFVSSDAHGFSRRPPEIEGAYKYLQKKYGSVLADRLCYENAKKLLLNKGSEEI